MNIDNDKKPIGLTIKFPLFVIAALVISAAALAQINPSAHRKAIEVAPTDSSAKEKLTDSSFIEKAALGGLAEVELSKLAVAKSSNKKIDKFATNMIKDHELANAKLKQLANSNRLPLPATLSGEQKKIIADLNSLSGDDFDRSYVDLIKNNHDTTVALFDNAAREATLNADFRVFANQTLPLLREQQKHSHALANNSGTSLTQTKKPIPKQ